MDVALAWGELKPRQQQLLLLACTQGINPKTTTASKAAIAKLADTGLLHQARNRKGRMLWKPTELGMKLIVSRGLEPTFMHRSSQYGYTHDHRRAMPHEPETMDEVVDFADRASG